MEEREKITVRVTKFSNLNVILSKDGIVFEIRRKIGEKKLDDGRVVPVFYDPQQKPSTDSVKFKLSRDEVILLAEGLKSYVKDGREGFLNFVKKTENVSQDGQGLRFFHATENSQKEIFLKLLEREGKERLFLAVVNKNLQTNEKSAYSVHLDPVISSYVFDKIAEKSIFLESVKLRSRQRRQRKEESVEAEIVAKDVLVGEEVPEEIEDEIFDRAAEKEATRATEKEMTKTKKEVNKAFTTEYTGAEKKEHVDKRTDKAFKKQYSSSSYNRSNRR